MARNNNDELIRQRNKDSAQSAAFYWNKLANDRISSLNLQLLTLSGILLPLTASLMALPKNLSILVKVLLFTTWIFLLLSIAFGLIQIVIDALYFNELTQDASKRMAIWSKMDEPLSKLDSEVKNLGSTSTNSTHLPIIAQASFISLALILVVVIGSLLLFE